MKSTQYIINCLIFLYSFLERKFVSSHHIIFLILVLRANLIFFLPYVQKQLLRYQVN